MTQNGDLVGQTPHGQSVAVVTTMELPWRVRAVRIDPVESETGRQWKLTGSTEAGPETIFLTDNEDVAFAVLTAFHRVLNDRR